MSAKWEIVRGTATDWKQHKAWWVMTYMLPGGTNADGSLRTYPCGPHLVRSFDGTDSLWIALPHDAHELFDPAKIAGRGKGWGVPASCIWARMPADRPEPPNVQICFEREPWTGEEA